ncbi:PQQ-dependent sugar dehydrogenase [Nitrososphaera viennensis]|uniref:PQQ-dependent sugar dehydrogenase n=2 Tax=Nitrososphaera viennensis TaxID=1034015 RepID=A0A977IEX2_9ARCH|nr:PQQ-dependent sugar dehydrogenase [Nitrososphaera viennensis]AIC14760.1 putative quinoprotein glucose/ sorbosone dehydrogenase [Nitrososphaera viennensis EN76]UVS69718.1 PQQ-dependent sugar dehydrogenase [Nitrososphaera viennensis]
MRKAVFAIAGAIIVAAAIAAVIGAWQTRTVPGVTDNITSADIISTTTGAGDPFKAIPDSNLPQLRDTSLKIEKVVEGLSGPTSMAFVGSSNNVLVTQKGGDVRLVKDGALQQGPLLSFKVDTISERGLLGVAYAKDRMFLYMTEQSGLDIRNRVYSYDLQNGTLSGKKMILDLPGTPGPNHDGGKMIVGPDGFLYAVIGDLNRNGMLQNYKNGAAPDNTSVILKVGPDGAPAANILSGAAGLEGYYAYGIRNSFGMDFDPRTGKLWDTENGPDRYDEVNVVEPGFNSGWERVMGPISRSQAGEGDFVAFEGAHYSDPAFSWLRSMGVTDIEFLNSTKLGKYAYNVFVGDINNGNLYYFTVNGGRDGFVLEGNLSDRVADNNAEASAITLGTGFGGITDIETGPDGNLYVLSYSKGSIYRIVPAAQ